jgi:hypothetical protein
MFVPAMGLLPPVLLEDVDRDYIWVRLARSAAPKKEH